MRADPSVIYCETVTLINRLDAKHALLKQDAYYATVIHGCMWSEQFENGTSSSGVVTPTTLHRVQIPKGAGTYMPYREWRKTEGREGAFTLRTGDYVVRGEVTEPVTAANIRTLVADYEPDAFQVRAWRDLNKPQRLHHSGRGVLRFAEGFMLEG